MPVFLKATCNFQVMIYTLKCLITFNFVSLFNYVYSIYIIRKVIQLLMFSPYFPDNYVDFLDLYVLTFSWFKGIRGCIRRNRKFKRTRLVEIEPVMIELSMLQTTGMYTVIQGSLNSLGVNTNFTIWLEHAFSLRNEVYRHLFKICIT
mgnify:CR=1 FL=1